MYQILVKCEPGSTNFNPDCIPYISSPNKRPYVYNAQYNKYTFSDSQKYVEGLKIELELSASDAKR